MKNIAILVPSAFMFRSIADCLWNNKNIKLIRVFHEQDMRGIKFDGWFCVSRTSWSGVNDIWKRIEMEGIPFIPLEDLKTLK